MMNEETIRDFVEEGMQGAGLMPFVRRDKSQFLSMPDEIFIELVLVDDSKREQARRLLMDQIVQVPEFAGKRFDIIVRSLWEIKNTGTPEVARSADGGIRAAVIVPVFLQAGSAETTVHVAISWLAAEELKRITGREQNLRELASAYVASQLKSGGQSYWDPLQDSYLEIGSAMALALYRMLKKTA